MTSYHHQSTFFAYFEMSIRILGWNLLVILRKERIWNALSVFSQVKLRMALFDFYKLFLDFGLLCLEKCSFVLKPHTPILDSHFFWKVKVIAQGPRVFMPRALSFRTKSRFSNEKSLFAFLRKTFSNSAENACRHELFLPFVRKVVYVNRLCVNGNMVCL